MWIMARLVSDSAGLFWSLFFWNLLAKVGPWDEIGLLCDVQIPLIRLSEEVLFCFSDNVYCTDRKYYIINSEGRQNMYVMEN